MEDMPEDMHQEFSTPLLSKESSEFMRDLLDPSKLIEKFEMNLRGVAINSDGSEYVQISKPKLNNEGIAWLITEVDLFSDKAFSTSNYKPDEIDRDLEDFEHALIEHLFSHYNEYDLDYMSDMRMLLTMVRSLVSTTRKKSQNATMLKNLSRSHQRTEIVHDQQNSNKTGMYEKFKRGMKF